MGKLVISLCLLGVTLSIDPVSAVTCPSDTSGCDCSWTSNGANCGSDDGSECWCKCCCASQDSCNFQGGGGGGGGSSTCALPAGMDEDTPAVDSTGFATCHGKLRLGGSGGLQLVGKDGETVQLMGMSSHGLHWFPDCYSKASIQHLVEDWGINVFRAAMYIGEGGYAHDPSQKDTMLNIVQWCKELGIYVIVDWHMLSPGNPNDPEYSGADAFWTEMATKLKDETHVLFEIANEPNGVSWSEVVSYHNRIIGVIRAIDTETVILAGTPTWSQEIDQAAATPVNAPHNVMYVFHFYAGSHMSLTSRVTQYASQIPIFVSEWGSSQASGDGGPYLTEAKQFLDLFNNAGSLGVKLSWTQWSYADKAEVSAALNPGSCAAKDWGSVTCAGKFARTYIRSNTEQCGPQTSVPGATDAPPTDMPTWSTAAPTPMPVATTDAPSSSVTCPSDTSGCDCSWTSNGANCGTDDGSECWCKCCCASQDSCNFQGGGGGGGGSSTCALPAGMDEDTLAVDSTGFATCHGKLRLGGSGGLQLVGKDGETVQLMGMSSHGLHWFPDCYSKASIQHLVEDWGINVFRAAMYIGEGGYAHDPSQKDTMLNIVQWCKELGIYVIVDWHMLSPGNPNDPEYSGADAFWTEMATKLKDETHVLFEIANEPNGVSWSEVVSYHNRIIGVIRAIDTETVILAGTPTWSQEIDQAAATPVNAPHNVMYVFHFYAGSHMSLTSRVTQYASQIPIFVSEWGSSQASGDGGPYLTEAKQFLDLFNNAGSLGVKLSWTQWSYADKAEVSAALNPGSCAAKDWGSVTCAGKFARTYIRSNTEQCGTMAPGTPETDAPATMAPVTVAPKTDAPSTSAPDTNAPLTTAPETRPPTTEVPATDAPKTATPTSVPAGKTLAPETTAPSTEAPLTQAPVTGAPETRPPTTEVPATRAPETATPTAIPAGKTLAPETTAPATSAPVTDAPLTRAPETRPPTTQVPVTEAPETAMPTALPVGKTLAPETTAPETRAPATSAPATDAPATVVPTALPAGETMPPATRAPATLAPRTDAPETRPPTTEVPATRAPETVTPTALPAGKTLAPETRAPATSAPVTDAPLTRAPETSMPTALPVGKTLAPETRAPATSAPATDAPATVVPTALPAGKTMPPVTGAPATLAPLTDAPPTRAPETSMPTALPVGKTLAPETTAPETRVPATTAPATDAPATAMPTALPAGKTLAPDTTAPATSVPQTQAPRTPAPETAMPTALPAGKTLAPETTAPATDAPATSAPATDAPETAVPTALPAGRTFAPRTETPDTSAPATRTLAPGTSLAPTTDAPETAQPVAVTDAPDTEAPATALPEGETVAPSYAPDRGTAPDEDSKDGSSFPWWTIVLIIVAVFGFLGLLTMMMMKRKNDKSDRLMLDDLERMLVQDDLSQMGRSDHSGKVTI